MEAFIKLTVLGLLTMVAIVLLFCECEKTWLLIATKVCVIPVAMLIGKLWRRWGIESMSNNNR